MHRRAHARLWTTLAAAVVGLAMLAPATPAATRAPLSQAMGGGGPSASAHGSAARPNRIAALRAMTRDSIRRYAAAGYEFEIASSPVFDAAAVEAVAASLRSLDHGPELASLSAYVATAEEIARICGATVIACYIPARAQMVVAGEDRPAGGVSRDFAIAHEYGHHIARTAATGAPVPGGTIRWATYERVCQLTRADRLHPGDQGEHYWENPEEAFAQSYAHLARPEDNLSWQYTALLEPTTTSLEKIHADVSRPWTGPVTMAWSDSLAAPPSGPSGRAAARGKLHLGAAQAVGPRPWVAERRLRTPLDGAVTLSLHAPPEAVYTAVLRDPDTDRILARASTAATGTADLSYPNCGNDHLELEVRSVAGEGTFSASITRP